MSSPADPEGVSGTCRRTLAGRQVPSGMMGQTGRCTAVESSRLLVGIRSGPGLHGTRTPQIDPGPALLRRGNGASSWGSTAFLRCGHSALSSNPWPSKGRPFEGVLVRECLRSVRSGWGDARGGRRLIRRWPRRVYHGSQTRLPKHYVARERLCLWATADQRDGRPTLLRGESNCRFLQLGAGDHPRLKRDVPREPTVRTSSEMMTSPRGPTTPITSWKRSTDQTRPQRHRFGHAHGIDHGRQKRSRSSLLMTGHLRLHGPARNRKLCLNGVRPGEDAAGLSVPVARVVEIAFEGMHDPVQPCGQRGVLVPYDLVGLLPCPRRQQIYRLG